MGHSGSALPRGFFEFPVVSGIAAVVLISNKRILLLLATKCVNCVRNGKRKFLEKTYLTWKRAPAILKEDANLFMMRKSCTLLGCLVLLAISFVLPASAQTMGRRALSSRAASVAAHLQPIRYFEQTNHLVLVIALPLHNQ